MEEIELYESALKKIEELKIKAEEYVSKVVDLGRKTCYTTFTTKRDYGNNIIGFDIVNSLFNNGDRVDYTISYTPNVYKDLRVTLGFDHSTKEFLFELIKAKLGSFPAGLNFDVPESSNESIYLNDCQLIDKSNIDKVVVGDFFVKSTIKSLDLISKSFPNLDSSELDMVKLNAVTAISDYKNLLIGEVSDIEINDISDNTKKVIYRELNPLIESQKVIHLKEYLSETLVEAEQKPKKMKI